MDKIQNKVARLGLVANTFAANEALRGEMGWSSYGERISRMKLNYKVKLMGMNDNSWAGYMYREYRNSEWHREIRKIERKYGLEDVYGGVNTKGNIKNNILMKGQIEWERGVESKTTLNVYKNKREPGTECFYKGDMASRLLFKARTGSLEVNGRIYRWNGTSDRCEWCVFGVKETVEHLIIECEGHERERMIFIEGLIELVGLKKWNEIRRKEDHGISIASGFECGDKIVDDNRLGIVDCMKSFLKGVWKKRECRNNHHITLGYVHSRM